MKNKLRKIANDTNNFLKVFIKKPKENSFNISYKL